MKKIFISILLLCSILSNAQHQENKTIIESLFLEAWNGRDFSNLEHLANDTLTFHINNQTFQTTFQDLKNLVAYWHNSFEGFKFEIHHLIAEDNMVAVNLHYSGIHINKFKGIEPSNRPIYVSEMMFFRFDEGKVIEAWEVYDELGMIKQMKGEN